MSNNIDFETLEVPDFSVDSFKNPKYLSETMFNRNLILTIDEALEEIKRLDTINLKFSSDLERNKFLADILSEFRNNYFEQGPSYKDYISYRYWLKEFVIKERVIDENATYYIHYRLSDWDEESKRNNYDDRILTVDLYAIDKYGKCARNITFKLFAAHKDLIFSSLFDVGFDNMEDTLPIYTNIVSHNKFKIFKKKDFTSWIDDDTFERNISVMITFSLLRYITMNYYMLNKIEENDNIIVENKEPMTIVDYIKSEATSDKKKVKIYFDSEKNISAKLSTDNKNIYSHNNHVIRTLCDYKFQVCAHYQHYWVGSGKDKKRILKWKESYYKNTDKEFNIIHEKRIKEDPGE